MCYTHAVTACMSIVLYAIYTDRVHRHCRLLTGYAHVFFAVAMYMMLSGLLFKKLPDLKIAIPFSGIQYTESTRDIGVVELPVTW
jgi:hypothetical protein